MVPSLTRAIKLSDAIYLPPPIPARGTCGTVHWQPSLKTSHQLHRSPNPREDFSLDLTGAESELGLTDEENESPD